MPRWRWSPQQALVCGFDRRWIIAEHFTQRVKMSAMMMNMRAQAPAAAGVKQAMRSARPMPRLMAFNGLATHQISRPSTQSLHAFVAARVNGVSGRRSRLVVQMAKKSVGDLTKSDLEGKTVLVRICRPCNALIRGLSASYVISIYQSA